MKKFLALILSLLMILSLCGCSEEPVEEPAKESEEEQISVPEEPEEPASEPEETPKEPQKTEVELSAVLGETLDDTYYHAAAGISVKVPEGWHMHSPDELVTDGEKFAEVLFCEDEFYNTIMVVVRKTSDFDTKEEIIEFVDTEWFSDEGIYLENKETGYLDIKDIFYSKHTYGGKISSPIDTYIVFMEGYIIEIDCVLSHNSTMDFIVSHINFEAEES